MITQAKNKIIGSSENKKLQEFHFSGSREYIPQTIRASSREDAEKEWLATRVKVEKQIINKEEINKNI
jgi:type II secretory pathway component PulL